MLLKYLSYTKKQHYSRAVCNLPLDLVRARNPIVNAWTYYGKYASGSLQVTDYTPDEDLILSQARALDEIPKAERGPLHGIIVAIRDVMNTKGISHLLLPSSRAYSIWTYPRSMDP